MNLTLGSVSGFLPTIGKFLSILCHRQPIDILSHAVKGLGYSNARAQLFSVPPYAVALVVMVLLSTISDRLRTRG